jgi:hypothetical protein
MNIEKKINIRVIHDDIEEKLNKKKEKNDVIYKLAQSSELSFSKDMDSNINLIDFIKNDEVLMTCEYEMLGTYNINSLVWVWATNYTVIDNVLKIECQNIINRLQKISEKENIIKTFEGDFLNYISSNGNFYIDTNNLLSLIDLCNIFSDGKAIITKKDNEQGIMNFIIIKKILSTKTV